MEPIIYGAGEGNRLERIAQFVLCIGLFLFPIAVVPTSWFPFALLKTSLLLVFLFAALILFVISAYAKGSFSIPKNPLILAIIALPFFYGLSALFSQNTFLSYVGSGVDPNTLLFAGVSAVAAIGVAVILRGRASLRNALLAICFSLLLAALFQIVQIAFGPAIFGMKIFSDHSTNLIGKWNEFGLSMGLLTIFSLVAIDIGAFSKRWKIASIAALVVSLGFVSLINLDVLWQVLATVAVVTGLVCFFGTQNTSADPLLPRVRKVPFASIVVLVVSVLFMAWGSAIGAKIQSLVPVSALEVRPAIGTNVDILKATYKESMRTALLGTGPGTFSEQWGKYKPDGVNLTQFWSLDFTGGAGVVLTAFVTTGILGGLVWVALILLLLFAIGRSALRPISDPMLRTTFFLSALGALFLLVVSVVYLSGSVILMLIFVLLGIALSALSQSAPQEMVLTLKNGTGVRMVIGPAALFILCAGILVSIFFVAQQFFSAVYLGKALVTPASDAARIETLAQKSLSARPNEESYRLLSSLKLAQAQAISNEKQTGQAAVDQSTRFQVAFSDAVRNMQLAAALNPRNYQNYASLGQLFESLLPLKVQGAFENAEKNYNQAITLSPRNPGLYLALARTEAQGGTEEKLTKAIQTAFSLKPNYTEVALLVTQVEVARNNIDGAIQAAEIAVKISPDNAGIWFEVGLLAYTKGNNDRAREALEQALKLQPEYANAKYFLGLTYKRLQRTQEAITLFENIQKDNPDNAEIKLILANLKAGKDPFEGAAPPITPTPETRPTAPIAE